MSFEIIYWLILLIPLVGFLLNGVLISIILKGSYRVSGFITVISVALSLILSIVSLIHLMQEGIQKIDSFGWLVMGESTVTAGFLFDPLTAMMLVVVNGVSLMIQIYSIGYMASDKGYSRYFSFMALFTFSMLGLVLSKNLIHLFVFWELVGISSYLLIGFWFQKNSAVIAAKKAFLMTRIGTYYIFKRTTIFRYPYFVRGCFLRRIPRFRLINFMSSCFSWSCWKICSVSFAFMVARRYGRAYSRICFAALSNDGYSGSFFDRQIISTF